MSGAMDPGPNESDNMSKEVIKGVRMRTSDSSYNEYKQAGDRYRSFDAARWTACIFAATPDMHKHVECILTSYLFLFMVPQPWAVSPKSQRDLFSCSEVVVAHVYSRLYLWQ